MRAPGLKTSAGDDALRALGRQSGASPPRPDADGRAPAVLWADAALVVASLVPLGAV